MLLLPIIAFIAGKLERRTPWVIVWLKPTDCNKKYFFHSSLQTHTHARTHTHLQCKECCQRTHSQSKELLVSHFYVSISAFWCLVALSLRWSRWQGSTWVSLPLACRLWWLVASFSDPCLRFDHVSPSDWFISVVWTTQKVQHHLALG